MKAIFAKALIYALNLRLFDTVTQTTLLPALSVEMKTYYEMRLLDNAEPKLIHDQFGDKYPIPKNGGKTIEFRKYSPLAKALTPLVEGVTPAGNNLAATNLTATVAQYGDWVRLSDILELTAIDRNVDRATQLLGSQAGRTLDTITREELAGGTNVIYMPSVAVADGAITAITSRSDITALCKLDVDVFLRAAAYLKTMNADPFDGGFVAIIHPFSAYDIMKHADWAEYHKYTTPENMYAGEIGKIGNVRFVESTEAKVFGPEPILTGITRFTNKAAIVATSTTVIPINEAISATQAASVVATQNIWVGGVTNTIASVAAGVAGSATVTLGSAITDLAINAVICGEDGGKDGSAVFSTLVLAQHAYGLTDIPGGGLQHIVKQLGYGDDPLNQRSSAGWKAIKVAKRLVEPYMVRIESGSTYSSTTESN